MTAFLIAVACWSSRLEMCQWTKETLDNEILRILASSNRGVGALIQNSSWGQCDRVGVVTQVK